MTSQSFASIRRCLNDQYMLDRAFALLERSLRLDPRSRTLHQLQHRSVALKGNAVNDFSPGKHVFLIHGVRPGGRGSRRAVGSMGVTTSRLSRSFALPRIGGSTKNRSRRCLKGLGIAMNIMASDREHQFGGVDHRLTELSHFRFARTRSTEPFSRSDRLTI